MIIQPGTILIVEDISSTSDKNYYNIYCKYGYVIVRKAEFMNKIEKDHKDLLNKIKSGCLIKLNEDIETIIKRI